MHHFTQNFLLLRRGATAQGSSNQARTANIQGAKINLRHIASECRNHNPAAESVHMLYVSSNVLSAEAINTDIDAMSGVQFLIPNLCQILS